MSNRFLEEAYNPATHLAIKALYLGTTLAMNGLIVSVCMMCLKEAKDYMVECYSHLKGKKVVTQSSYARVREKYNIYVDEEHRKQLLNFLDDQSNLWSALQITKRNIKSHIPEK